MLRKTERLARETSREYALRVIKDSILKLDLKPGTFVSANDLAMELGISKTPVREALTELAHIGIIEIYPQSGSRISLVDFDLVDESRFMRNTLECAVAKEACALEDSPYLSKLRDNVKLQEFYLQNHMNDKLLELDNEFHQTLFEMTNKLQIYDLMRGFSVHFDRLRSMTMVAVKELKTVQDHKDILHAIESHQADKAAEIMDYHLSRYKIDMDVIRAKYPDCFNTN